jgi:phage terminase large subunit
LTPVSCTIQIKTPHKNLDLSVRIMQEEKIIVLPYNFKSRPHQKKFLSVMNRKFKKAFLTWHRRGGKDLTAFNFLVKESQKKTGLYVYVMPTWSQCKRNIWDAMTTDGVKFLDCIPEELLLGGSKKTGMNESELQITFANGSIIQMASGEKYNRLRGMNARGFVLSEYAFMHPNVIKVISPILLENNGFLVINTTPNGKNHAFKLWQEAQKNVKDWFTELLTIRDTKKDDGSPVISEEKARQEQLEQGLTDQEFNSEYFCSYEGSVAGTYYESLIQQAEKENRIGVFPWNPKLPVYTAWDIGVNDAAAIWFYQLPQGSIQIIDHYENEGLGVDHYIKYINSKPYSYPFDKAHFVPHDFRNRIFGISGEGGGAKSAYDTAISMQNGKNNFFVLPKVKKKALGIQEVRSILPRCTFNRQTCELGLDALTEYHSKYDTVNDTTSIKPVHDWASNSADAFQALALSIPNQKRERTQEELDIEVNPLNRLFSETIDRWVQNRRESWMGS